SRENSTSNRYLYNQGAGEKKFNTERVADLDLNVDQSRYRTYDFATGRWWQVDPKGDFGGQESWSTYQFGFDNPIRYNDPEGDVIPILVGLYYLGVAAVAVVGTAIIVDQADRTIQSTAEVIRIEAENSNSTTTVNSQSTSSTDPPPGTKEVGKETGS